MVEFIKKTHSNKLKKKRKKKKKVPTLGIAA